MTDDDTLLKLSQFMNLPPVSRDLLKEEPKDPYLDVFYKSALSSKAWLDLNPDKTSLIFKEMVEAITSGRKKTLEAFQRADAEIETLVE